MNFVLELSARPRTVWMDAPGRSYFNDRRHIAASLALSKKQEAVTSRARSKMQQASCLF